MSRASAMILPLADAARHRGSGFRYRAHNGVRPWAVVVAPAEFGPHEPSPPLPLVIPPVSTGR